ncbi:MAG: hypothetical protein M0015_09635 [Betaproteobacteria bacterium]|nr:hypothetical protein [Betaproteobacteria bacterium]
MKAIFSVLFAGLFLVATASAFAAEPVKTDRGQIVADQDSSGSQDSASQGSDRQKSND